MSVFGTYRRKMVRPDLNSDAKSRYVQPLRPGSVLRVVMKLRCHNLARAHMKTETPKRTAIWRELTRAHPKHQGGLTAPDVRYAGSTPIADAEAALDATTLQRAKDLRTCTYWSMTPYAPPTVAVRFASATSLPQ